MSIKNTVKIAGKLLPSSHQIIYLPTSRIIPTYRRRIRTQLSSLSGTAIQTRRLARQQDIAS